MFRRFLILLFFPIATFTQSELYERDTSYTINSAFQKEVKNFPFIEPVMPILPDSVNAKREVTFVKYGTRELKLDIFHKGNKNELIPAVILIHGGGWRSGNKSLTFPMALQLAKKGFAAISIEYRLSPEALFPAAIIDVNNAIKWVKQNASDFGIDTSKIALLGCSAGGQIASLTGFASNVEEFDNDSKYQGVSKKVAAVVNVDGLLDFLGKGSEEFDENPDDSNPRSAHKWLGASQIERPDLWKKASGIHYIKSDSPPILFINSSRPRFHAGRDEAVEILKNFKIYYKVHTLENTPHSFWLFHPWFKITVDLVEKFLLKVFAGQISVG